MTWTTIRLELARTTAFPRGSAARSYVLRLPLGLDGRIDEQEYRQRPELATVRRFWSNEPDRHGRLLHTDNGWTLCFGAGDGDVERIDRLEALRPGACLTLTEPDGTHLPFLIKGLAPA